MTPSKIKQIRKALNLTQEGLARELDVAFVTVNRWERGKQVISKPHVKELKRFAKKAGVVD